MDSNNRDEMRVRGEDLLKKVKEIYTRETPGRLSSRTKREKPTLKFP